MTPPEIELIFVTAADTVAFHRHHFLSCTKKADLPLSTSPLYIHSLQLWYRTKHFFGYNGHYTHRSLCCATGRLLDRPPTTTYIHSIYNQ
jgi:hypothetical protein